MKKLVLASAVLLFNLQAIYAQNTYPYPQTGSIGIGTTSPANKFQVNSDNDGTGVTDWIAGNFGAQTGDRVVIGLLRGTATIGSHNNGLTAWSDLAINADGGNVSIGTSDSKGYRLAVNGNVIATAVTVKLFANWPDYVFSKSYHLPALADVQAFIDQHQHLPEMPSAAEVEKNGTDLGLLNQLLTKKVEELTLYLIQQDQQVAEQRKQLQLQQEQINQQKAMLEQLVNSLNKK